MPVCVFWIHTRWAAEGGLEILAMKHGAPRDKTRSQSFCLCFRVVSVWCALSTKTQGAVHSELSCRTCSALARLFSASRVVFGISNDYGGWQWQPLGTMRETKLSVSRSSKLWNLLEKAKEEGCSKRKSCLQLHATKRGQSAAGANRA